MSKTTKNMSTLKGKEIVFLNYVDKYRFLLYYSH